MSQMLSVKGRDPRDTIRTALPEKEPIMTGEAAFDYLKDAARALGQGEACQHLEKHDEAQASYARAQALLLFALVGGVTALTVEVQELNKNLKATDTSA